MRSGNLLSQVRINGISPQRRDLQSDVPRFSEETVPATRQDRKRVLCCQPQNLRLVVGGSRAFSGEVFSPLLSACRRRSMHETCSPYGKSFLARCESWFAPAKRWNAPTMYGTQVAYEPYLYGPSPCACCWYEPCSDGPQSYGLSRARRCRLTWRQLHPCPRIVPAEKWLRLPDAHGFPKREASGPCWRNAGVRLVRALSQYDVHAPQLLLPGSHGRGRRPRRHYNWCGHY